jgi:hypothetical protein
MSNRTLKKQLFEACYQLLDQKKQRAEQMILSAETARNNETKSSAGDKFETGRAMMQMERDKAEMQLYKVSELQALLSRIDIDTSLEFIDLGSLVITNESNYFLAIPLGKILVENKINYAISLDAPLGVALKGSKKGNEIIFQGRTIQILDVE